MKTRMLLIAVALLAFAAVSYGQGDYWLYEDTQMITCPCASTNPVPDGVEIEIWWDKDGVDGPSAGDSRPPTTLPAPYATRDHLNMGAVDDLGENSGYFMPYDMFNELGMFFSPNKFYLIIRYCCAPAGMQGDSVVWTSHSFVLPNQGYAEQRISDAGAWTCETFVCGEVGPSCVPTLETWFENTLLLPPDVPGPEHQADCVTLCPGFNHTIYVGPHAVAWHSVLLPIVNVYPGCDPVNTPCLDPECLPAAGFVYTNVPLPTVPPFQPPYSNPGWVEVEIPVGSGLWFYVNTIVCPPEMTGGCACVSFEWKWPVEMKSTEITALDNAVSVNWVTASETNLDAFKIMRDDVVIATVDATNEASEHSYTYVDETATNGTTYTYKLVVVDATGASDVVATESVTPSFENAVVTEYKLHQNYPNPFNPTTRIAFDVLNSNPVSLTVYNATGQVVATLLNNTNYSTGRYSVDFNAANITSGLYFYTVKIGNEFTATKKMLLVK